MTTRSSTCHWWCNKSADSKGSENSARASSAPSSMKSVNFRSRFNDRSQLYRKTVVIEVLEGGRSCGDTEEDLHVVGQRAVNPQLQTFEKIVKMLQIQRSSSSEKISV